MGYYAADNRAIELSLLPRLVNLWMHILAYVIASQLFRKWVSSKGR